jgi:DNA polymerase IV
LSGRRHAPAILPSRRPAACAARALAAWLTDRGGAGWFGEARFAPTWDDRSILKSLGRLFGQAHGEAPVRCRSVHVVLHDLVPLDSQRRDLFDVAAPFEARRRWERLSVLADLLHARYGRDMLSLGPSVEPPGGYAGAKIAFNRIPEDEDF